MQVRVQHVGYESLIIGLYNVGVVASRSNIWEALQANGKGRGFRIAKSTFLSYISDSKNIGKYWQRDWDNNIKEYIHTAT